MNDINSANAAKHISLTNVSGYERHRLCIKIIKFSNELKTVCLIEIKIPCPNISYLCTVKI